MLLPDIPRGTPLSRLRPRITFIQPLLPDLHEGILTRRIRAEIHDAGPVVARRDDVVAVVTVVVVPVEGEVVAGGDSDGIGRLYVAHDVAAEVERGEIFYGRVGVAAGVRGRVVGGCANACEEALVDAIDEDALGVLVGVGVGSSGWQYPYECVRDGMVAEQWEDEEGCTGQHVGKQT